MRSRSIAILGSTGSIGGSTLDVIARHPDRFRATALAARANVSRMFAQCMQFRPEIAGLHEVRAADQLQSMLRAAGSQTRVVFGDDGLREIAEFSGVDTVMAAIVGAAGLVPTISAARAGKKILLANKEALVMAGGLFMAAVRAGGSLLLPIDSEHNAVFQSLPGEGARTFNLQTVRRIVLTASGGPFLDMPLDKLSSVTPDQACAHPNWVMGRKISVDSASMMNKGLEVIEAHWLFGVPVERIEVVIHPQSIVHSLVEYVDGSMLAQLGNPDMRTPIAHALAYPERVESGVTPLDLAQAGRLDFRIPDLDRFPCLKIAYSALRRGGCAPTVLNAANEIAVEHFLGGRLAFTGISALIEEVLEQFGSFDGVNLDDLMAADTRARLIAQSLVQSWGQIRPIAPIAEWRRWVKGAVS